MRFRTCDWMYFIAPGIQGFRNTFDVTPFTCRIPAFICDDHRNTSPVQFIMEFPQFTLELFQFSPVLLVIHCFISQINIRQTGNLLQREYILQNRNGMCLILHGNFNIAYHSLQHLKFRPFSVTGIYDVPWCRGSIRVRQILRKYFCTFFVMFILPFIKV